MEEKESPRRKFLKFLGLSAGATIVSSKVFAGVVNPEEIRKLNPQQQEFMLRYGTWMDEFIEVIHVQKKDPANTENNKKMMELSERGEVFKPELAEYMKDENFTLIYSLSIERMRKEI